MFLVSVVGRFSLYSYSSLGLQGAKKCLDAKLCVDYLSVFKGRQSFFQDWLNSFIDISINVWIVGMATRIRPPNRKKNTVPLQIGFETS